MERLKFSCGDSVCSSLERESSQVRSWVAEDFTAPREDTARASCGNGAKRKLLPFPAERLFVSMLIPIQTLAQRYGVEPVILHPFATLIPVLGLHHVVLGAEFLQPTVQMEPERTRFITSHHVTGELLLFSAPRDGTAREVRDIGWPSR